MKIYLFSGSGFAWRVLLACVIKGIDYEEVLLQPSPDDLKSDAFMKLSPRGKVPVLTDGNYVTPESMAAIAYLDRKYPKPSLFGKTPEETGSVWRLILDFDLYVSNMLVNQIIVPILTGQSESAGAMIQEATRTAHTEIAKLEAILNGNNWFVGNAISAADIAIYTTLEPLIRFATKPEVADLNLGFDKFVSDYPSLTAWRSSIQALPGYDKTYPAYWRQADQGNG